MFSLSWQVTVAVADPAADLRAAGPLVRPQAAGADPGELRAERLDEHHHDRAVQRVRRAAGDAVRSAARWRPQSFGDRAGRVRDIGITTAMYGRVFIVALGLVAALAQALTYGLGGALALNGSLEPGAVVSLALLLTRLYGPLTALSNVRVDVMSALVSFERVFEVLDLKPLITEKPDARPLPRRSAVGRVRRRALRLPRRRRGVAGLPGGRRRPRSQPAAPGAARGQLPRRGRSAGRAGRSVRGRQDDHLAAGAAGLRRRRGRGPDRRHRRPGRDAAVAAGRDRRRRPGRAPVPRHHPGQPAVRPARRHRGAS